MMPKSLFQALLVLVACGGMALHAQTTNSLSTAPAASVTANVPPPTPIGTELISNSNFALATRDPTWPDGWSKKSGITLDTEKETHYLHFVSNKPASAFELGRSLSLPVSKGIKALQVSLRYRAVDLKLGTEKGAGASVKFQFFDVVRISFSATPAPLIFSDHAVDWTVVTTTFRVPANAVTLEIGCSLSPVNSGTFDLAEFSVKNIAETDVPDSVQDSTEKELDASTPSSTGVPVPIRREGERTIIGSGNPSIWFIAPYVDVLGHDFAVGIANLVCEAHDNGHSVVIGVAKKLDDVNEKDEANTTYIFSYKNINYPLPTNARRMVFLNTWLTPPVEWPASRTGKKDVVIIGSGMLHNDGDGSATDKDRWTQIQKDDPTLAYTVLDSTGYYFPLRVWSALLLKVILEEQFNSPANPTK